MVERLVSAGLRRMMPRDPLEPHRPASALELFFDLTFVVGVSVAASELLHAEEVGATTGVALFLVAFFSIWWPWVNFTWFASAFDTDDWLYRLLTIVQMGGVLVVAAGVRPFIEQGSPAIAVVGYVVMRLALVVQWLRASRHPMFRNTARRYAGAVALVQLLWVLLLVVPDVTWLAVPVLIALEMSVPPWAERRQITPFHLKHIAERYGLFTLIVLGEGLLTVTNAVISAQGSARSGDLVLLGATALVLIAGMWWIYFSRAAPVVSTGSTRTFAFGYLHYVVFGSAAALAAGVELAVGHLRAGDETHAPEVAAAAATTVPLALFLLGTWFVVLRMSLRPVLRVAFPVLAVAAGLAAFLPFGLQIAALVVGLLVVLLEVEGRAEAVEGVSPSGMSTR